MAMQAYKQRRGLVIQEKTPSGQQRAVCCSHPKRPMARAWIGTRKRVLGAASVRVNYRSEAAAVALRGTDEGLPCVMESVDGGHSAKPSRQTAASRQRLVDQPREE
jgi:hypothetical protein